ncbi:DUF2630 family protein [Streptomyces sp. PT12]|uniref:DUF2630 family protein n=1 Tax=Streptomyces sp. PT12 TaxID=1510197 RepID=UPI000DE32D61|nr:DUF2630 family protein [Streptomyces sp. PT12]RBM16157.1 DUF2630 domain-containing protein [Streptomyces sp. PT12]
MEDKDILVHVGQLVDEERVLRARAAGRGLRDDEQARLDGVEARLDQCWDLLRRRRVREGAGEDPDGTTVRPAWEVEGYES